MTRENNSYIVELCVKTKLPNTFFDALQSEKLAKIYEKIDNVGNAYFRNNIAKVQLLYNEKQEEWELNYFTSKDGKVLGTEACYEETIVLYDKVTENGIVQNSIAENAFMENEE